MLLWIFRWQCVTVLVAFFVIVVPSPAGVATIFCVDVTVVGGCDDIAAVFANVVVLSVIVVAVVVVVYVDN